MFLSNNIDQNNERENKNIQITSFIYFPAQFHIRGR